MYLDDVGSSFSEGIAKIYGEKMALFLLKIDNSQKRVSFIYKFFIIQKKYFIFVQD